MSLLLAIASAAAAAWLVRQMAILVIDALATLTAASYYWQRERLCAAIGASATSPGSRRLLARHLQLSIDMTAHFSLFPRSALRGYTLAQRLVRPR